MPTPGRNRPPVLPDGTKAPALDIYHRCPECAYTHVYNVYLGVPRCVHDNTVMEPYHIVQYAEDPHKIGDKGIPNKDRTDIDWPEGYGPT